jgi:hypothetical protein
MVDSGVYEYELPFFLAYISWQYLLSSSPSGVGQTHWRKLIVEHSALSFKSERG